MPGASLRLGVQRDHSFKVSDAFVVEQAAHGPADGDDADGVGVGLAEDGAQPADGAGQ